MAALELDRDGRDRGGRSTLNHGWFLRSVLHCVQCDPSHGAPREGEEEGVPKGDPDCSVPKPFFSSGIAPPVGPIDNGRRAGHASGMAVWIVTICLLMACTLEDPGTDPQEVRISVDRETYSDGDTAVVTVDNALDSLVTTVDHQSFCWIAQLQVAGDDDWVGTGECFSMAPAQEHSIGPAGSQAFHVPVMIGTDAYPALVHPGRYRWHFTYSTGRSFSFSRSRSALSREFTVH